MLAKVEPKSQLSRHLGDHAAGRGSRLIAGHHLDADALNSLYQLGKEAGERGVQAAGRDAPVDPRLRFTGMTYGISFYAEDLPGRTLAGLFADEGFFGVPGVQART